MRQKTRIPTIELEQCKNENAQHFEMSYKIKSLGTNLALEYTHFISTFSKV